MLLQIIFKSASIFGQGVIPKFISNDLLFLKRKNKLPCQETQNHILCFSEYAKYAIFDTTECFHKQVGKILQNKSSFQVVSKKLPKVLHRHIKKHFSKLYNFCQGLEIFCQGPKRKVYQMPAFLPARFFGQTKMTWLRDVRIDVPWH